MADDKTDEIRERCTDDDSVTDSTDEGSEPLLTLDDSDRESE